jgi:hypothetical protein
MSASENTAPARAGLVLGSLIAVAAVANLGLAVANVALPSIGRALRRLAGLAELDRRRLLARARRVGLAIGNAQDLRSWSKKATVQ